VRALREHLDLNQEGLAELLGVRQQTISEWETGLYAPSRGRSKHLDLVAERSGFGYKTEDSLPK
jgi:DNA-binding transcriptional regulator YiaG